MSLRTSCPPHCVIVEAGILRSLRCIGQHAATVPRSASAPQFPLHKQFFFHVPAKPTPSPASRLCSKVTVSIRAPRMAQSFSQTLSTQHGNPCYIPLTCSGCMVFSKTHISGNLLIFSLPSPQNARSMRTKTLSNLSTDASKSRTVTRGC